MELENNYNYKKYLNHKESNRFGGIVTEEDFWSDYTSMYLVGNKIATDRNFDLRCYKNILARDKYGEQRSYCF